MIAHLWCIAIIKQSTGKIAICPFNIGIASPVSWYEFTGISELHRMIVTSEYSITSFGINSGKMAVWNFNMQTGLALWGNLVTTSTISTYSERYGALQLYHNTIFTIQSLSDSEIVYCLKINNTDGSLIGMVFSFIIY